VISTTEALEILLGLVAPLDHERVPLLDAYDRVLASAVTAKRAQPPFAASAMDGYAINTENAKSGDTFEVIGEAAAGHAFGGMVADAQAVRIFTGAPVPSGTKRILIQEDVERLDTTIKVSGNLDEGLHIRPAGGDFDIGAELSAPRRLTASNLALIASMNCPDVSV